MIKVDEVLHTNGKGFWSTDAQAVRVVGIDIGYINEEGTFGDLRVYFDEDTWSTSQQGLIYTDPLFLQELCMLLKSMGLAGDDVDYSEQGLQGRKFVSLDAGKEFLDSYIKMAVDRSFA
mgnify:CR=1 FL=1